MLDCHDWIGYYETCEVEWVGIRRHVSANYHIERLVPVFARPKWLLLSEKAKNTPEGITSLELLDRNIQCHWNINDSVSFACCLQHELPVGPNLIIKMLLCVTLAGHVTDMMPWGCIDIIVITIITFILVLWMIHICLRRNMNTHLHITIWVSAAACRASR